MSQPLRVAVLIGSLRAESFSRKIARSLMASAPSSLTCRIVEIGELPLYNEDLEVDTPPAAWSKFRSELRNADAALFVTPEYNRSIPGCLKNALDVGSRPPEKSVFDGMPAGVVSVTPYKLGAFGANHALRQTFVFLNMPVLQQPEVYIGNARALLDEQGQVKDEKSQQLLSKFMSAFASWCQLIRAPGKNRDFEAFMQKRRAIAGDYVNGRGESLDAIVTRTDPATFLSPAGDLERGAEVVAARYSRDVKSFREGGQTTLEVLQAEEGDLAFWTGLQSAQVNLAKGGDPVSMTLRVTEVFRFEDGDYKLVHRHADAKTKP